MPLSTAGAWIGAGLLVLAGVAKVRRPAAPGRALVLAGLPGGAAAVRGLGVGEVLVATLGLSVGGPAWALQAVVYAGFTAFVARERRRPTSSCGCFGEEDVPVTGLHVVVDGLLAVAAGAAAFLGAPGLLAVPGELGGWLALPLAAVATLVVRMLLVDLPVVADAIRTLEAPS
jgi:hypothetical protein